MTKVVDMMNKGSESGQIDINGLPKYVILNIITHLSIQEAVKTSILSRKWRYAWTELSELVFDDDFCEKSILNTKSTLVMAIYQVLLLHRGPLCDFTLCLSNLDGTCSAIDQFLLVALKKGVKNLVIGTDSTEEEYEPYRLPSSIYEYGQQLEELELHSCVFRIPFKFNGFSKLERLVIEEADISGERLSSIISKCPLLEYLEIESWNSAGCLNIDAPNLEYLAFESDGMRICFKNAPRLAEVDLCYSETEDTEELIEILESVRLVLSGNLPVVEDLTLDSFYLQCYHLMFSTAPNSLVNDISRVKTLLLWGVSFGVRGDVISDLCLIRNIPNLEKLRINVSNVTTVLNEEFLQVEDFSDVTLGNLREVEFCHASGLKGELQFIKLILAKSPVMEKFVVSIDWKLACKKKLQVCKELTRFGRASPLAVLEV